SIVRGPEGSARPPPGASGQALRMTSCPAKRFRNHTMRWTAGCSGTNLWEYISRFGSVSVRGKFANVRALSLSADEAEVLHSRFARSAEPVRSSGVEFGDFAGVEEEISLSENDPEETAQNVYPVVP